MSKNADRSPTLIDILSSMEVTPDILRRRAEYWTGVAIRHVRANRLDQAARIRKNVRLMRAEARRLDEIVAVTPKSDMAIRQREAREQAQPAPVPATNGKKAQPAAQPAQVSKAAKKARK